jgi:urease accessory protein
MARLAWYLGDRHIPAELHERRVRVRRDAATETLLNALASILGAKVLLIEAPFEPEGGAYSGGHHHHGAHGHDHGDHGHEH